MPVVRLTQKLKRQIEQNVETVASKIKKTAPVITVPQANKVVKSFISHFDLDRTAPECFKSKIINLQILYNGKTFFPECTPITFCPPAALITYGRFLLDTSITGYTLPADIVLAFDDNISKTKQVFAEYNILVDSVDNLLRRCTTLKQLIEAWPKIEQFIPENAMDKYRTEEGRRRKKGVYLETEELDALNQTLLAAQMTT